MGTSQKKLTGQLQRLDFCFSARKMLLESSEESAVRLFNGYAEGIPGLVVDLYSHTAAIFNLSREPASLNELAELTGGLIPRQFPWVKSALYKTRHANSKDERLGVWLQGDYSSPSVLENKVSYAIDLRMQQDSSFYLDTRNLRRILKDRCGGQSVLNTFAYTGSLGIAALAGGARKVVQTDRNARYLKLAERSAELSQLDPLLQTCLIGDFFRVVSKLKVEKHLFDWVILDPPFFSSDDSGSVDIAANQAALINKVRPLVAHGGTLAVINNGLFVSGEAFLSEIKALCQDGYMWLEELVPVPADCTGYPETVVGGNYPADYQPFNGPTKIVLLKVERKDEAVSTS